jgi:hypothetical protein
MANPCRIHGQLGSGHPGLDRRAVSAGNVGSRVLRTSGRTDSIEPMDTRVMALTSRQEAAGTVGACREPGS